jgi:predicted PurR-regulated permease PerM
MTPVRSRRQDDDARFFRRVLIVGGAIGLAFVLVKVAQVLLLAFGAVLVAIILRAVASPIRRRTPLGDTVSLAVAVAVLVLAGGLLLWLFGSEAERQFASLSVNLPDAWLKLQAELSRSPLGERLLVELRALDRQTGLLLQWAPRLAGGVASAAASLVVVLFAGLFLAARPDAYLAGVERLFPPGRRARVNAVLSRCAAALRHWQISQAGSMAMVGVCVGVALWIAGVRSPLALGLLAALGQTVPLVGPFVVAAPGVLLALADSPQKCAWAVAIYVAVGQCESNLFSPFMLRRMVQLPMAVTLFGVLAFGVLLGPLGVLFGAPLAVVLYVLVKMLYIEDLLGDAPQA